MAIRENNDALCFRVMRLNRPLFAKQQCEPAEPHVDEVAGSLVAGDMAVRSDLDGITLKRLSLTDSACQPELTNDDVFNAVSDSHELMKINVGGPSELLNFTPFFGTAYLGETFSAHVNLYNQSNETCHNVEFRVALHNRIEWLTLFTSSSLTGTSTPFLSASSVPETRRVGVELAPGQSLSAVVYHELKELGVHTLRCTASYSLLPTSVTRAQQRPGTGDALPPPGTLTFERLYKFQSTKPLDVKKNFSTVNSDGSVFMEAQVQNLTTNPIFLERVTFEPSANMTVMDLSSLSNSLSTQSQLKLLRPDNVQQFLFRLTPHQPASIPPQSTKQPSSGASRSSVVSTSGRTLQQPPITAGRLDITWRSTMGERGRLQTSSLKYEVPLLGDIQVKMVEVPATVKAEQPFHVKVEVANRCPSPIDVTLDLRNASREPATDTTVMQLEAGNSLGSKRTNSPIHTVPPMVWMGLTTRKLGSIPPGTSIPITFDLMATVPGLQVIPGVLIRELTSGRDYEFNNLGQVLVSAF